MCMKFNNMERRASNRVVLLPQELKVPSQCLEKRKSWELLKCIRAIMEMALVNINCRGRREVEARGEDQVAKDQNASTMVIALGFNVGVGHQKH